MGHSNLFICFDFFTELHQTNASWYTPNYPPYFNGGFHTNLRNFKSNSNVTIVSLFWMFSSSRYKHSKDRVQIMYNWKGQ